MASREEERFVDKNKKPGFVDGIMNRKFNTTDGVSKRLKFLDDKRRKGPAKADAKKKRGGNRELDGSRLAIKAALMPDMIRALLAAKKAAAENDYKRRVHQLTTYFQARLRQLKNKLDGVLYSLELQYSAWTAKYNRKSEAIADAISVMKVPRTTSDSVAAMLRNPMTAPAA